jgi:hypothetical protein
MTYETSLSTRHWLFCHSQSSARGIEERFLCFARARASRLCTPDSNTHQRVAYGANSNERVLRKQKELRSAGIWRLAWCTTPTYNVRKCVMCGAPDSLSLNIKRRRRRKKAVVHMMKCMDGSIYVSMCTDASFSAAAAVNGAGAHSRTAGIRPGPFGSLILNLCPHNYGHFCGLSPALVSMRWMRS